MLKETWLLVRKDLLLEWRQKYALAGVILYVFSVVYLVYTALSADNALKDIEKKTWNILFWVTILFAAVNAVVKSFNQESRERYIYYYTILDARAVILAKLAYNTLIMLVLSSISSLIFFLMIGNPVQSPVIFVLSLVLGAIGFSFVLTMLSAIASKAGGNATLMAILSFPLLLPTIMLLQKLTRFAFLPDVPYSSYDNFLVSMLALDAALAALSYILFPYLWRD
ncbi:MAG: heme exporter protein CcmB [Chitinophagales bacterium]|nr:heme exporter protein CcmB [Chitinophagales bacterium]